jgi:hypothetical protein
MSRTRIIFASLFSSALLFAGLLIGSIRMGHTADTPATRQPFSEKLVITSLSDPAATPTSAGLTVAAGKTMVVEYASASLQMPVGQKVQIVLNVYAKSLKPPNYSLGWPVYLHGFESANPVPGLNIIMASQPISVRLQAGDKLWASVTAGKPISGQININGYIE